MASLYIKDPETAAIAARVATQLGTSKTEAVKRGLRCLDIPPSAETEAEPDKMSTAEWLRSYRARFPLPDQSAMKIDKAFYDSLSDEEDVVDPWSA